MANGLMWLMARCLFFIECNLYILKAGTTENILFSVLFLYSPYITSWHGTSSSGSNVVVEFWYSNIKPLGLIQ